MISEPRALTVTDLIDRRPLSRFQITTIALCGLVMVLDGFDAQSIGFLAPSMAETLGVPLKAFGPVFAGSLIGLMAASMAMGPVADRWGRKWSVVFSTLTFAIFAMLTGRANTFHEVVIFRFLTGLGLGGSMPNVVALTSEYAPKRLQHVLVTTLFCGMPLGALIGGLASSVMIPIWGWRSVFYLGGILPLVVSLVLIKALPESVRFLAVRGGDPQKIAKIMAHVAPELANAPVTSLVSPDRRHEGLPVKHLFTEGRAFGTILLWVPYFMNLLIIYFIVSWLPALLRQAAMPISAGVAAISMFSSGGIIGSVVQGRLMNGFGAYAVLLTEFVLSTLFIGSLAFLTVSFPLMMTVTFILGCSVQASQSGLSALAASFYPTAIRSTGVGWALGVGRIGSIVGPVLGGVMLSLDWNVQQIFLAGAIPALCAGAAVLLSSRLRGNATAYRPEPDPDRSEAV
ncbi:MAG: MFS transporter [Acidobacteriia bacterium]|nr:MFS transporter [Terriglobia bacterium]